MEARSKEEHCMIRIHRATTFMGGPCSPRWVLGCLAEFRCRLRKEGEPRDADICRYHEVRLGEDCEELVNEEKDGE